MGVQQVEGDFIVENGLGIKNGEVFSPFLFYPIA